MASRAPCEDAHIVLTGPMGSGKTTVGRLLADRLGRPLYDSDAQIQERYGTSARRLAEERGVDWLHDAEAEAMREALARPGPAVVAAAASVADRAELGRWLGQRTVTILLEGEPEVLATRARTGSHRRRVELDSYRALTERRRRSLIEHVDLVLDVTALPPERVAAAVLDYCGRGSSPPPERDAHRRQ